MASQHSRHLPCPNPPTNGTLSTTSRDYLTVVTYSCDTGYILTGNSGSARTCQASGQEWHQHLVVHVS